MTATATNASPRAEDVRRRSAISWTLSDTSVILGRDLRYWTRNPALVIGTLAYPAVTVLLFGYVFGSAMGLEGMEGFGGDAYRQFLMPGLFVQTMAFGVSETMTGVATDLQRGVTDRFRTIPMQQSAVVIGRSVADMAGAVIGLVILMVCGWLVGWSWNDGLTRAAAAIGLLLLLRFALVWMGIYIGLLMKTPEAAQASWMVVFPLTIISSTFVQPSMMPGWLGTVATWNPISATVDATRELFGNPGPPTDGILADHAIALAVLWPVVLIAVFLPLAARRYRMLGR